MKMGSRLRRPADDQRALVEAIASWTESLRDTISSAAGLEQAIIATENHCPRILAEPVQRLVASLRYGTFEDALRRFADDVAHPSCDFVVAALITSSTHHSRDLSQLLGHLSECARSECELYLRIWVSRARTRTSVRIISGTIASFALGLLVFNAGYLRPFLTTEGCAVFLIVSLCFAGSLVWMAHIARVETPARLLATRQQVVR
jgi:Flp pilus assembly protein TadB